MAKTARSGVKPPPRWRCLTPGCPLEGVWRDVVVGEEYVYDDTDPRGHYWNEHYLKTEAEFAAKLAAQKQRRMDHYRLTGEFLPPEF